MTVLINGIAYNITKMEFLIIEFDRVKRYNNCKIVNQSTQINLKGDLL